MSVDAQRLAIPKAGAVDIIELTSDDDSSFEFVRSAITPARRARPAFQSPRAAHIHAQTKRPSTGTQNVLSYTHPRRAPSTSSSDENARKFKSKHPIERRKPTTPRHLDARTGTERSSAKTATFHSFWSASDKTSSELSDISNSDRSGIPSTHDDILSTNSPRPVPRSTKNYTPQDDKLLHKLRHQGLSWTVIASYFPDRTVGSLSGHYSEIKRAEPCSRPVKGAQNTYRPARPGQSSPLPPQQSDSDSPPPSRQKRGLRRPQQYQIPDANHDSDDPIDNIAEPPTNAHAPRRKLLRRTAQSAKPIVFAPDIESTSDQESSSDAQLTPSEEVYPAPSIARLSRLRELGLNSRTCPADNRVHIQNAASTDFAFARYMDDASGDVSTIAWSKDGSLFAAGAVALTDPDSMQYNRPNNLLIGDAHGHVKELPDHHSQRPRPASGANASMAMQHSQDPRLFHTVQMVDFSPTMPHMYAVDIDGRFSIYDVSAKSMTQTHRIGHLNRDGPIDCLSVGQHGLVAIGVETHTQYSINVLDCSEGRPAVQQSLYAPGPSSRMHCYPSSLKWGTSPQHAPYLLAGFSQKQLFYDVDTIDVQGRTCLWDVMADREVSVTTTPRSVFDVAWNVHASGHTAFAVASVASGNVQNSTRSVVRLFSPSNNALRHTIELECPAYDLNDVMYCPYDDNLIAAGSTDGRVYIWDTRWSKVEQTPQRCFTHGSCLSVLSHERPRWQADTGIRFLSWGCNATQLYSGSSDGLVKCWNPYLAPENNCTGDIAQLKSALMSGAFSPDYSSLLLGEDRGRISLYTLGHDDALDAERFDFEHAPIPVVEQRDLHKELLSSGAVYHVPCGDLPVRQTVRGPNYKSSTLSSALGTNAAEERHNINAPDVLEADFRAYMTGMSTDALQSRADDFQSQLRRKRKESARLRNNLKGPPIKPCELDCAYMPFMYADPDDKVSVVDDARSMDRIPDQLCRKAVTGLDRFKMGLVAVCSRCHAPARPASRPEIGTPSALCEKCAFACLRCGEIAELDGHAVRCARCELQWRADCLGYELVEGLDVQGVDAPRTGLTND